MRCPCCSTDMVAELVLNGVVMVCPSCFAGWFPRECVTQLGRVELAKGGMAGISGGEFSASGAPCFLSCRECGSGSLVAGTVGEFAAMQCSRCQGLLLLAPNQPRAITRPLATEPARSLLELLALAAVGVFTTGSGT